MSSYDVPRPDPSLLARLREDLSGLDFTVDGIADRLGPRAAAALHREQPLPAARRVAALGDDPLAGLIALFGLGLPVPVPVVAAAVRRTSVEGLCALGLARVEGEAVRATCDLRPYGDESHAWWVASDLGELATGGPLRTDHVLGIGGASTTLASWTPRPDVPTALDLGTGCGVQALHLSGHAGRIVATDLSRRALGFAAFNAALAGLDWDLRHGSLLEPVAGERFDLIVSNPPFVITPRAAGVPRYEYRDGGATGDGVVAGLVRGVGAHQRPGGIAALLGNWEVREGEHWRDVWAGWLQGSGLDAVVVQRDEQDPCEYAETWARDGGHRPGTPAYDDMVGAWLDDFEARGVREVGFGVITLRRPEGERAPHVDLLEHEGPVAAPMGPAVLARLQAQDWLAGQGYDGLLARRWKVASDVTEERYAAPGAPDPSVILLRQGGGLGRSVRSDTVLASLAAVSDGDLTAGAALSAIAAILERPVEEVREAARPGLERLVLEGMLVPA